MSESMEEKLARIERGETFEALRKAGKIELTPPSAAETNGKAKLDGKYPYTAKGLVGLRGTHELPHTTIVKKGVAIRVPVMPDRKTEREFAAKWGYRRD
jgi:hypothetical protein